ncbi:MAG: glycosyltransferase family 2 protein [Qingshengfaniella sp.]
MTHPDLSIVVPVFNEEDAIPIFLDTLRPILGTLGASWEIIFIDDGSSDGSVDTIRHAAAADPSLRLVRLSRNFGKEAALTAGLDAATGAAVIPMDVDLQDPPELIADFVGLWRVGYDVVYGQRVARDSDTSTKRASASLFYRVFNAVSAQKIEPNAGDFRLMSRAAVEATLRLRERNRFMKGLFAWVGFKTVAVPYSRPERSAGESKFSYWKLWNFALDGVTSFSTVPLRIWTYVGLAVALGAMLFTLVILAQTLFFGRNVPGYASIMVVILILGAVQLISLGVMGEYLGRLYMETKQRPIYLVSETLGFEAEATPSTPGGPVDTASSDPLASPAAAPPAHKAPQKAPVRLRPTERPA